MKSCLAAVLLLLVILQSGGMMVCYTVQQEMIREEMMEELRREEKDTEILFLLPEEFTACRVAEREIRYNGRMYDIRSVERKGRHLMIKALRDHKEESLLGALQKMIHHSKDKTGRVLQQVLALSFVSYLPGHPSSVAVSQHHFLKLCTPSSIIEYVPVVKEVVCPPPEFYRL
jgi:hypothetical protein